MLDSLRELISRQLEPKADPAARERGIRAATAALMVEMVRADAEILGEEAAALHELLARHFKLPADEVRVLIAAAERQADAAVSLLDFTQLLNDTLDGHERARVLELLWRVALADKKIDRYEELLVRKVADLLYLPNSEVVRTKLKVQAALAG
jgi:uncharacterized tellurite resistance protein B-like protein